MPTPESRIKRPPRWRFTLIDSRDMTRVGELRKASNRKCDVILDKPGAGGFDYNMQERYASDIVPYQTGILAERYNWRATLARWVAGQRGAVWDKIWSGYVLPISENITDNKMSVSCVGWQTRFGKRIIRRDFNWNDIDDAEIIGAIINEINGLTDVGGTVHPIDAHTADMSDGYTLRWPVTSDPNTPTWVQWGGTAPNEGTGGATAYVEALRKFKAQRWQFAQPYIDSLVSLENGCDLHLDPATRILTAHRRYERVKSNVVLSLGFGPRNMATFGRDIDANEQINYFLAQGEAGVVPQYAHDTDSMDLIGPIEETAQISGAGSHDVGVLLAYAGAEVLIKAQGHITYGITPFPYNPNKKSVPEPFVDYREGDTVSVVAKHLPRVNIVSPNNKARVFGFNVTIDDTGGNEKIGALQLAP